MALTATKTEAVASSLSNFIDGRFVATGKSTFENRDPVTGELVNLVAEADATMVDDALKATTMGPPISQEHRKKVLSFYDEAEGAHRVAAQIEVGITWVNAWFLCDLRTPFGGSKQSGIGREGGVQSIELYTELRNVCVKL